MTSRIGWEEAAKSWQEVPKGGIYKGNIKKIWYNPAIIPLWAAIGGGAALCAGFMVKYFSGHTEISFSKSMRATYDHQGLSESRVASHNTHFGFRSLNKHNVNIFPFNFLSMENIAKKHGVNYPDDDE